jgi:hypothetical protein
MATLSTPSLNWLAAEWEKTYKTAVLSGIVGDLAHKARGGYHISREDQPSSNYSVTRADDKAGNGPNDRASAIDMTMSTADIKTCHIRLRTSWKNRANDSRWKYINAWNGWDGVGDAGRYDVVTGNISTATADHKWHIHLEIRRKYVNDMNAMRAILSLLKGEPATAGTPAPVNSGDDDDMALTDADVKKIWDVDYLASGDEANPTWQAKTLISYRLNNINTKVDNLTASLRALATSVASLEARIGGFDVDELAVANAIAGNAAYIDALATAIAAKVPDDVTPEELTAALKQALREGVAE